MTNIVQFNSMASQEHFPKDAKVNFIHDYDRTAEVRGGNTIAYCLSDDGQTIYFAVAKCHVRDQYCKKVGCKLAMEHAQQGKVFEIQFKDCCGAICDAAPAIKYIAVFSEMNFHYISRSFLNKIVLWSVIRMLGKYYYDFLSYAETVLEHPHVVPPTCAICPKFMQIMDVSSEADIDICDECFFQSLLYNFISKLAEDDDDEYEDDEYDDDEDDWN